MGAARQADAPRPWKVFLVDRAHLKEPHYTAIDESEARAWAEEWNSVYGDKMALYGTDPTEEPLIPK